MSQTVANVTAAAGQPAACGQADERDAAHDLRSENAHLRAKLASLPTIEQAKGVLMGRYQISPDTAFALLCRWSSHSNEKVHVISELLVRAAQTPPAPEPATAPTVAGSPLELFLAQLQCGH